MASARSQYPHGKRPSEGAEAIFAATFSGNRYWETYPAHAAPDGRRNETEPDQNPFVVGRETRFRMSCNTNGTKFGLCTAKAGIGRLSSQAGSVAATVSSTLDNATNRVGQRVAPVSNRVLKTVDRPTTIAANLLPALATAAVYTQVRTAATGPGQGRRPRPRRGRLPEQALRTGGTRSPDPCGPAPRRPG